MEGLFEVSGSNLSFRFIPTSEWHFSTPQHFPESDEQAEISTMQPEKSIKSDETLPIVLRWGQKFNAISLPGVDWTNTPNQVTSLTLRLTIKLLEES